MRKAEVQDHWRHVSTKNHPFRVSSIKLFGIPGMGNPETEIEAGSFVAICGHNGSGKTTLLRCIQACLDEEAGVNRTAELRQIGTGEVVLSAIDRGTTRETRYNIASSSRVGPAYEGVYYFEPSASTPSLVRKMRETVDLKEILETVGYKVVSPEIYSYAVGKKYDRILSYEPEIGEDTVPYFIVDSHGARYASDAMGLGEFSMFYLIWWLESVPNNSLVLIEEPEAFISPRSQAAVANIIAKFTDDKKLFTILTTHSPLVLGQVPPACIRVLVRRGVDCVMSGATDQDEHLAVLGVQKPPMGIAFVEDIYAQYALEAALREFAPGTLKNFSIVRRGSWNEVIGTLNGLPREGHPMDFMGVLDADQRVSGHICQWPLHFLPGEGAPDVQMLDAICANVDRFASLLGIARETVVLHISNIEGIDPHDWAVEFAGIARIELMSTLRAMGSCWVRDERWSAGAKSLAQALERTTAT